MYIIIRSQDQKMDSRLQRYISAQDRVVKVMSWERQSGNEDDLTFNLAGQYGEKWGNLWGLLRFNFHICLTLLKLRKEIRIVHSVDLDTSIVAYLCSRLLGFKFVFETYDNFADSRNLRTLRRIINYIERSIMLRSDLCIIPDFKRLQQYGLKLPEPHFIELENVPISENRYKKVIKDRDFAYIGVFEEGRYIVEISSILSQIGVYDVFGYGKLENEIANSNTLSYRGALNPQEVLGTLSEYRYNIACYDPRRPNNKFAAPNKFFETIFAGTPLITNEGTLLADKVKQYGVGITFSTFNDLELKLNVSNHQYSMMLKNIEDLRVKYVDYLPKKVQDINAKL